MHPSSNEPYQQPFVQHGFVNLLNAQSSVPSYSFITNTNDFTNQASADMVHDWDMQGENGYDDDGVQDSDDDMSYDDDSSDDDSFDDCLVLFMKKDISVGSPLFSSNFIS